MDDLIGSKYENDLEHSIKSLDYLIGNFIEFLEKENLIENTAIFISADHSLPINKSLNYINNKLKNTDRSLYLISNKDINSEDEILQVHLPEPHRTPRARRTVQLQRVLPAHRPSPRHVCAAEHVGAPDAPAAAGGAQEG